MLRIVSSGIAKIFSTSEFRRWLSLDIANILYLNLLFGVLLLLCLVSAVAYISIFMKLSSFKSEVIWLCFTFTNRLFVEYPLCVFKML